MASSSIALLAVVLAARLVALRLVGVLEARELGAIERVGTRATCPISANRSTPSTISCGTDFM